MRVALAPSFGPIKQPGTATPGRPLLDERGACVVLGWTASELAEPIAPTSRSLFGPRGVCLHPGGSLWVCDTGHHRLLGWRTLPGTDNQPAEILVGQADFCGEGRNAKDTASAASLNVPTGVCAWGDGLAVADAWNHRVLLWRRLPVTGQPADVILGQTDPAATHANRGGDHPNAGTLHWPYGVAQLDGALVVADTGNRRVLIWYDPQRTGQPADLVLGQPGFATRDENAGDAVGAGGMRWPHGLALWQGHLAVSDAGNNRIMLWNGLPTRSGRACDAVLGQAGFSGCDHNRAAYYPSAEALNMPYGLAVAGGTLVVADTASSRLVGFRGPHAAAAERLTGQPDFASKGDNRWGPADRSSLCWPYGLSILGNLAAVADSGNNRVMLWPLAPPRGPAP